MAHFARQKRQSRFYWAELGFLALGLVGLQPSLFTNLLAGSQSKLNLYQKSLHNQESPYYPALDSYRDWTNTHLSSYMPTQPMNGLENQNQRWPPSQAVPSVLHQTSYPQSAYRVGQFSQPSAYAHSQQQLYAQQLGYSGAESNPNYLSYTPQSANYHPQQLTTRSLPQSVPNGWQNQAVYHADSINSYTNPNASTYGNSLTSQSTNFGSNPARYQPRAAYQPYSRLSQQPIFESGYDTNYRAGTASAGSAAQNYPYTPNATNSGAWRPYRPATSIYR